MEWDREMETGIAAIDVQHRRIVDYINELEEACRSGNADLAKQVMEGVLNYTVTHFEFEEELQEKAGYPYLKAHQRIHEVFMKKVASFRERANKGEDVAQELLNLLKNWLKSHIQGEDRDYIDSVKKITGD